MTLGKGFLILLLMSLCGTATFAREVVPIEPDDIYLDRGDLAPHRCYCVPEESYKQLIADEAELGVLWDEIERCQASKAESCVREHDDSWIDPETKGFLFGSAVTAVIGRLVIFLVLGI